MADTFILLQKDDTGMVLEAWLFSTLANAQAQLSALQNPGYSTQIIHTAQSTDAVPPSRQRGKKV